MMMNTSNMNTSNMNNTSMSINRNISNVMDYRAIFENEVVADRIRWWILMLMKNEVSSNLVMPEVISKVTQAVWAMQPTDLDTITRNQLENTIMDFVNALMYDETERTRWINYHLANWLSYEMLFDDPVIAILIQNYVQNMNVNDPNSQINTRQLIEMTVVNHLRSWYGSLADISNRARLNATSLAIALTDDGSEARNEYINMHYSPSSNDLSSMAQPKTTSKMNNNNYDDNIEFFGGRMQSESVSPINAASNRINKVMSGMQTIKTNPLRQRIMANSNERNVTTTNTTTTNNTRSRPSTLRETILADVNTPMNVNRTAERRMPPTNTTTMIDNNSTNTNRSMMARNVNDTSNTPSTNNNMMNNTNTQSQMMTNPSLTTYTSTSTSMNTMPQNSQNVSRRVQPVSPLLASNTNGNTRANIERNMMSQSGASMNDTTRLTPTFTPFRPIESNNTSQFNDMSQVNDIPQSNITSRSNVTMNNPNRLNSGANNSSMSNNNRMTGQPNSNDLDQMMNNINASFLPLRMSDNEMRSARLRFRQDTNTNDTTPRNPLRDTTRNESALI